MGETYQNGAAAPRYGDLQVTVFFSTNFVAFMP